MSLTSRAVAALAIGSVGLALTACGTDSSSDTTASGSSASAATEIRLGYFPNVTHAVPIVPRSSR
jgi:NitT/TauT family transport system substrate-binding protein